MAYTVKKITSWKPTNMDISEEDLPGTLNNQF